MGVILGYCIATISAVMHEVYCRLLQFEDSNIMLLTASNYCYLFFEQANNTNELLLRALVAERRCELWRQRGRRASGALLAAPSL